MAEPLKAMYTLNFLRHFGDRVHAQHKDFNTDDFVSAVMAPPWDELELKARMRRITDSLGTHLGLCYQEALGVLFAIEEDCVGFPYLFFPDFVEVFGQAKEDWELSMKALERFTKRSSSEFAVRVFLLREPVKMMAQMEIWSKDPNEHVRRLSSEGCRPRLPWGQALPMFKLDPVPVIPVLEQLKSDPSLYVRKSVANNLNDIAKDNPKLVIEIARRWKGIDQHTDWIVRHGCRSLIRKADPEIMELFGYATSEEASPLAIAAQIHVKPSIVQIGGSCNLEYELRVREGDPVRIRIEYAIDFVKANGRTSRKSFLLSDKTVPGGTRLSGERTHRWSDLTTRRHYPGEHKIALIVNGWEVAFDHLLLE